MFKLVSITAAGKRLLRFGRHRQPVAGETCHEPASWCVAPMPEVGPHLHHANQSRNLSCGGWFRSRQKLSHNI